MNYIAQLDLFDKMNKQKSLTANYSNISAKMRLSKILKLDGSSQIVDKIGRISGKCQFGNFYLGQPMNINCLGRTEGMAGGSGRPPLNRF
jgi:hypothetical protein